MRWAKIQLGASYRLYWILAKFNRFIKLPGKKEQNNAMWDGGSRMRSRCFANCHGRYGALCTCTAPAVGGTVPEPMNSSYATKGSSSVYVLSLDQAVLHHEGATILNPL
jgi:hypothetical protein